VIIPEIKEIVFEIPFLDPSNDTHQDELSTSNDSVGPILACDEPFYREPLDLTKFFKLGASMLTDYRWYLDHVSEYILDLLLQWFYDGLRGAYYFYII